jgi:hypothetical protein
VLRKENVVTNRTILISTDEELLIAQHTLAVVQREVGGHHD